jgi:hypothetical protein
MVDEIVVGFEDAVREPVVAHELPDIFDRIELGAFWRQRNDGDVGRHDEAGRQVPASLINQATNLESQQVRGIQYVLGRTLRVQRTTKALRLQAIRTRVPTIELQKQGKTGTRGVRGRRLPGMLRGADHDGERR